MITGVSRILSPIVPAASAAGGSKPSQTAEETKWSNGKKAVRNFYPKRATGTLSNEQKARLCILSRQAFEFVNGKEPATQREASAFRHDQVTACLGKPGLTACVQSDYKKLEAWFMDLTVQPFAADKAREAHETEPVRLAMAKLKAECAARGLALGYPAAICRKQFKCELAEASHTQLWKLVFTVKNRRSATSSTAGAGAQAPKKAKKAPTIDIPF